MQIKKMPIADRPIEKLFNLGEDTLTDTELLAILINSGFKEKNALDLARDLYSSLNKENTNRTFLENLSKIKPQELLNFKGLGITKVARLITAIELGKRIAQTKPFKTKQVYKEPNDVAKWMRLKCKQFEHEYCYSLYLNIKNELIAYELISKGDATQSVVNVRDICGYALKYGTSRIILTHNHPSGYLTPSIADKNLTKTLSQMCDFLGLDFLDHIITSKLEFYSMREKHPDLFYQIKST